MSFELFENITMGLFGSYFLLKYLPGKVLSGKKYDIGKYQVESMPGGFLGHVHDLEKVSDNSFKILEAFGHYHPDADTIIELKDEGTFSMKSGGGHIHKYKVSLK